MVMVKSKKFIFIGLITFIILPIFTLSLNFLDKAESPAKISTSDEIPNIDLSLLPQIDYDAINKMWYEPKIEMLIITPAGNQAFYNAAIPLMEWKNLKGVKTIIANDYTNTSVERYGPATDTPEMIRNMIKWYYDRENIQWVLLAADAEVGLLPMREVYNPDVLEVNPQKSETSGGDNTYKPTDFYYADLTGDWDKNENGKWGESQLKTGNTDEIDWIPEVYVGRLPASTSTELEIMINKTIKYEKDPEIGDWMNRMLLGGGLSDTVAQEGPDGENEAYLTQYIWQNHLLNEMKFKHLIRVDGFSPATPPPPNQQGLLTQANFVNDFNNGYSTVIFAGHGASTALISESTSGQYSVYTATDASSSSNNGMPSLIYADACTTSPYDVVDDGNLGEILIKRPDGGAIGFIGGSRVTWYYVNDYDLEYLNRATAKFFWQQFFREKRFQQGKALYDSKVAYLNSDIFNQSLNPGYGLIYEWERKNVLTYNLLGDPEVDVYTNKPGNLTDYFAEGIYEGQLIKLTIMDNFSRIVPYARVHMKTQDGKYHTEYADRIGRVIIQLPKQVNETYNVTITGHNLLPQFFNFTTKPDEVKPELISQTIDPKPPSVSDNVCFDVETIDTYSGVESAYVFFSNNDFNNYNIYRLSNETQENEDIFSYILNKLDPGEYSYLIVARDYANNTKIFYETTYIISIPAPLMNYVLITVIFSIFSVAGISIFYSRKSIKSHEKTLSRLEEIA
jgi:hypothetical protein